jgi:hypothetical protein
MKEAESGGNYGNAGGLHGATSTFQENRLTKIRRGQGLSTPLRKLKDFSF